MTYVGEASTTPSFGRLAVGRALAPWRRAMERMIFPAAPGQPTITARRRGAWLHYERFR